MNFDPTLPVEDSDLDAAQMRNQFKALKALNDALQQQLAPLVPGLNRDNSGQWTLSYKGPEQTRWQVWWRYNDSEDWTCTGETPTSIFPASDSDLAPGGATWWQVKLCGLTGVDSQTSPFTNIVSFGPVPDAP